MHTFTVIYLSAKQNPARCVNMNEQLSICQMQRDMSSTTAGIVQRGIDLAEDTAKPHAAGITAWPFHPGDLRLQSC
jgi:hypothetical protein